jgi:hypothetical protein
MEYDTGSELEQDTPIKPANGKMTKHIPDINLMISFHMESVVLLSKT